MTQLPTEVGGKLDDGPRRSKLPAPAPVSYTGDPFIITAEGLPDWARVEPHFMDMKELGKFPKDRFAVPNDFDEFYAWKPDYVLKWVKVRLSRFVVDAEVEDLTQELLLHLCQLSPKSKYRRVGKKDIVQTFDPIKFYGANEPRFRSYLNTILKNRFVSLEKKRRTDALFHPGNVPLDQGHSDKERDNKIVVNEEFVHQNSALLSGQMVRITKQHNDRMYTTELKQFVTETDPSVYPALEALESTDTISEAARFMSMGDWEFSRFRHRLKQLGESFENGTPVPKRPRTYKKRSERRRVLCLCIGNARNR